MRPVLRAVLGLPPGAGCRGCRPRGRFALHRVLQPRVHGDEPRRQRQDGAAQEQEHRHRHGPRAHGADPPGQTQQLRDRPDPSHHRQGRVHGRNLLRRRRRRHQAEAQGHRRSHPRRRVPRLRRRSPVQRRPRVHRPPVTPPRGPMRPPPRRQGTRGCRGVHSRHRRGCRRDERRLRPRGGEPSAKDLRGV